MNSFFNKFSREEWYIILIIIASKIVLHLFTANTYGLHRDAYLYIAQSEHLSWGFVSVPPVTATLIALQKILFGDTVLALRLIPVVAGVINTFLVSLIVKELGGKRIALLVALLAYLFSPAFLRSNSLLQPVSLNQMFWVLSAYVIILITKYEKEKYWIWLGIIAGVSFLTKYSVVFFFTGFMLALLVTRQRIWLKTRSPYLAVLIAFIIALPNLIWQYNHNWPVVSHMQELYESQLVHVKPSGFLLGQLLMNFNSVIIWMLGLFFFLVNKTGRRFNVIGWTIVFTIGLLIYNSGKAYYTLGLYPVLFAGGGILLEKVFKQKYRLVPYLVIVLMIIITIPIVPFSMPVLSYPKMVEYGKWAQKMGMKELLRWEDGKYYELPQDFADMTGWEETANNVAAVYHELTEDEKQSCLIYGDSYGQAGAINYYRKQLDLPEAISFNGSFVFWIPEYVSVDRAIYVTERSRENSDFFHQVELKSWVKNPYARDKGYVYLLQGPKGNIAEAWNRLKKEEQSDYVRKE